jgi:hypothetical protein
MLWGFLPLETEHVNELPIPAWGYGVIAFVMLAILMLITLAIGKGRVHS